MNTQELIPVFTGTIHGAPSQLVDARELHRFLEVDTHFKDWIARRITEYRFQEGEDFRSILSKSSGGRRSREYHITLDMGKELAMVERNDKGRQARRYFIDMERKALEAAGQPTVATRLETLLPSEQQTLSEVAHRKAEPYGDSAGKALAEIWSRLHHKFRITQYGQLPRTQLADAVVYIAGMQLKLTDPIREALSKQQWSALCNGVHNAVLGWFLRGDAGTQWIHNRMRTEFNIRSLEELPPARVPEALALLSELGQMSTQITSLVTGLRDAYYREVIGAGAPWTPWLVRQLGGTHMIPANPDWKALGQALLKQTR